MNSRFDDLFPKTQETAKTSDWLFDLYDKEDDFPSDQKDIAGVGDDYYLTQYYADEEELYDTQDELWDTSCTWPMENTTPLASTDGPGIPLVVRGMQATANNMVFPIYKFCETLTSFLDTVSDELGVQYISMNRMIDIVERVACKNKSDDAISFGLSFTYEWFRDEVLDAILNEFETSNTDFDACVAASMLEEAEEELINIIDYSAYTTYLDTIY